MAACRKGRVREGWLPAFEHRCGKMPGAVRRLSSVPVATACERPGVRSEAAFAQLGLVAASVHVPPSSLPRAQKGSRPSSLPAPPLCCPGLVFKSRLNEAEHARPEGPGRTSFSSLETS